MPSMTYDAWERTTVESLRRDPTWKVEAYRLGLYVTALAWADAERFVPDPRSAAIVSQLIRSAGSIAATITEGYGRRSPKERVRYYEYALSSAGEVRAWYASVATTLGTEVLEARLANLLSITRLLLTMIRRERGKPGDWMHRDRNPET
jgi:four helix bundle protein